MVDRSHITSRNLEAQKNRLRWFGAILTVAIVVLVVVRLGGSGWSWLWNADLNNLGDFFAGAVAPLAFLWLVIGYFQQNLELSAQLEEMKESRSQFKAQAEALTENSRLQKLSTTLAFYNQGMDSLAGCASTVVAALAPVEVPRIWTIYANGDREQWFRILTENRNLNEQAILLERLFENRPDTIEQARNYLTGYSNLLEGLRLIGDDFAFRDALMRSYASKLHQLITIVRDRRPEIFA